MHTIMEAALGEIFEAGLLSEGSTIPPDEKGAVKCPVGSELFKDYQDMMHPN